MDLLLSMLNIPSEIPLEIIVFLHKLMPFGDSLGQGWKPPLSAAASSGSNLCRSFACSHNRCEFIFVSVHFPLSLSRFMCLLLVCNNQQSLICAAYIPMHAGPSPVVQLTYQGHIFQKRKQNNPLSSSYRSHQQSTTTQLCTEAHNILHTPYQNADCLVVCLLGEQAYLL